MSQTPSIGPSRPPFRWRCASLAACVLLLSLTVACLGGGRNHTADGGIQVFNDGSVSMRHLYVTPSTNPNWGADQLAPDTLLPGDALTVTGLYPAFYDVRAEFADASSDEAFDVLVLDGYNATLSTTNTGRGAVSLVNHSGLTINAVYLTSARSSTWGPNQVDGPLAPGGTLVLTGLEPDTYDLQVVFAGGTTVDFHGIVVTSGTTASVPVN